MVYFTSDLHFGHHNVLHLSERPFETIEEMEQTTRREASSDWKP